MLFKKKLKLTWNICYLLINFALGVFCLQQLRVLPSAGIVFALLLFASLLQVFLFFIRSTREYKIKGNFSIFVIGLFFLTAGFAWAYWRAIERLQTRLSSAEEMQKTHVITGTIVDLPQQVSSSFSSQQGWQFLFELDDVQSNSTLKVKRLLLTGYRMPETPIVGQRWRLIAQLKKPHGLFNPGGRDYEAKLLQQAIDATGVIRSASFLGENTSIKLLVQRLRFRIVEKIAKILPKNSQHLGIIQALAVGRQSLISTENRQRFRATGCSHLLAISGLHITLFSGWIAVLSGLCWRKLFPRWTLKIATPYFCGITALCAAFIYGHLAGLQIPVQRALCMLTVFVLSLLAKRAVPRFVVFCWALFFVLFFDPWAVLAESFWLSFLAVAVILAILQKEERCSRAMSEKSKKNIGQKLWLGLKIQLALCLSLLPIQVLFFSQLSLLSLPANVVAVPVFSIALIPLILLGVMLPESFAQYCFFGAEEILKWLSHFFDYLLTWPGVFEVYAVPNWILIALFAGILCAFLNRKRWGCWILLSAPLFVRPNASIASGEFCAVAFDVGQGSAILVSTQQHQILFDTGPAYSAMSNAAKRVILPYLQKHDIDSLDLLVLSHKDHDHSAGLHTLFDALEVKMLMSPLSDGHKLLQHPKIQHKSACEAGQSWRWDGVEFQFLHPLPGTSAAGNAESCVLRVVATSQALLLPGDISTKEEHEILQRLTAKELRASILLMPHHGSRTSSGSNWLRAVQAELAIAQVGYRHRFNHPHADVIERYKEYSVEISRTDLDGAVTLCTKPSGFRYQNWRTYKRRYWHQ